MAKTTELLPEPEGPALRPWRELALLASILMELSWVVLFYPVFFPVDKAVAYPQALWVLAGMLVAGYLLGRTVDFFTLRNALRWGLLGGIFIADELIGMRWLIRNPRFSLDLAAFLNQPAKTLNQLNNLVPAEFFLLALVFWAWWRGISLVSRRIGPNTIVAGFRTGIVGFFLYGLALPLIGQPPAGLALVVFLFSSLLAMSAARIHVLSQLRGGQRIPFRRTWLAGILLVVSVTAAVSTLAAETMRVRAFTLVSQLYTWTLYLLAILLGPLLLLFMRGLFLLGEWLKFDRLFASLLDFIQNLQATLQKWIQSILDQLGDVHFPGLSAFFAALYSLRFVIFWLGLLLAVFLALLTLQRQVWKREFEGEQQSEQLLEGADLGDLLGQALRRGLSRAAAGLSGVLRLRPAGQLLAAARIRRIYARLLGLSARLDRPRPAAVTPLEFLPSLEQLFPGQQADLQTITRAYLQVRYGERTESLPELKAVEVAWKRILVQAKPQLSAQKRRRRD